MRAFPGVVIIGVSLACAPWRAVPLQAPALQSVPPQAPETAYRSTLSAGVEDVREGRYSSAKAAFESAAALYPARAEPWYQLGLLDGQMADYRDAEQSFRHALALNPRSAEAHCRLGQTLVADPHVQEDWAGAVAEFRAALQIDPNYPEAESLLGLGLMHLGDTDAAIATLKHAIQLHPNEASAHLNLALALETQPGNANEAAAEYRAALALKPDAPETETALGKLLLRQGRMSEAEQAFRAALKLNPDIADAHYGLARVLKAQKNDSGAAVEFDQVTALQQRTPDNDQAIQCNNAGLNLAAQGNLAGSVALLRKALLLRPDYGIAKYNLGLVLADSGDYAEAREELIQAVSLMPAQAKAWFDLGRVLLKLGDRGGALQTITWAARLAPSNPRFAAEADALRALAPKTNPDTRALSTVNSRVGSTPADTALHRPPFGALSDTAAAHLAFAQELMARGDSLGAIGELLQTLALQPNSVDARVDLARSWVSLSRWDYAAREYRKLLLVAGPEDVAARLALGQALLNGGHAAEAADQFRKVLASRPGSQPAQAGLSRAMHAGLPALPQN